MFDEAEAKVVLLVVDQKLEVRKVFPVEVFALSDLSNFGYLIVSSTRRHGYLAKYLRGIERKQNHLRPRT